jgi:hypothetical protein
MRKTLRIRIRTARIASTLKTIRSLLNRMCKQIHRRKPPHPIQSLSTQQAHLKISKQYLIRRTQMQVMYTTSLKRLSCWLNRTKSVRDKRHRYHRVKMKTSTCLTRVTRKTIRRWILLMKIPMMMQQRMSRRRMLTVRKTKIKMRRRLLR